MWEIISYKLDNKTLLSDNKEMNRYLLAAVFAIALLVVGAGAYFLINQQPGTDNPNTTSVSGNNQTSNQIEGYSGALIAGKDSFRKTIIELRNKHVFAFGESSKIGAQHIMDLL